MLGLSIKKVFLCPLSRGLHDLQNPDYRFVQTEEGIKIGQVGDRSLIPAVGGTCRAPCSQDKRTSHSLEGTTGRNCSALELKCHCFLPGPGHGFLEAGNLNKPDCPEGGSAQGLHTVPSIHAQHGQLLATPAPTCSRLPIPHWFPELSFLGFSSSTLLSSSRSPSSLQQNLVPVSLSCLSVLTSESLPQTLGLPATTSGLAFSEAVQLSVSPLRLRESPSASTCQHKLKPIPNFTLCITG